MPNLIKIGIESGFLKALFEIITMQIQLSGGFFLFSLRTKAHYFGHTILHGGAKYRATGHGFVIHHVKAMEIIKILIYFKLAAQDFNTVVSSSIFILVASWSYIPFIFNPLAFSWNKGVEDWED